jgi:hypothetical protein
MGLLANLKAWGEANLSDQPVKFRRDPKFVLYHLHAERGLYPPEIGDVVASESRAVRFWLDAFEIETNAFEPGIIRAAKKQKFSSLADYFRSRWKRGFHFMCDELKVSRATVESYYKVFIEELEKETSDVRK